jgi:hypothetical protein
MLFNVHVFSFQRFGNMWQIESLYFDANLVIMATVMTAMTAAGIGSAFLVLLLVLLPLMIKDRGVKIWGLRYEGKDPGFHTVGGFTLGMNLTWGGDIPHQFFFFWFVKFNN